MLLYLHRISILITFSQDSLPSLSSYPVLYIDNISGTDVGYS